MKYACLLVTSIHHFDYFLHRSQDVSVRLVSERSIREVTLEDDSSELSTVNSQSFVDEQEWRLYSSVDTRRETVIRIYQGDDCIRPSFTTLCYAARRFGFYAWNIIFVMVKTCGAVHFIQTTLLIGQ